MTSIEQDFAIQGLSLSTGGASLAIREGYLDGHVEATVRSGQSWKISLGGDVVEQTPDFSVDWSAR